MKYNFKNTKAVEILFLILSIIIILPTLFYPMFGDISIFLEAGRIISEGKKIYVDFIDIKPVGFYYFFALIYKLFGYSEIGIRIFNLIYQSATIFLLYIVVKRYTDNYRLASISIFIYSISFAVTGENFSVTPEAFLGLFLLISLLLYNKISKLNLLLIGIVIGIAVSFKYTFFVVFLVYLILNYKFYRKQFISYSSIMLVGLLLSLFISMLPLLDGEIFVGFMNVLNFISEYSSIPTINAQFVKYILVGISQIFTYYYSLSLFILMIVGFYISLKEKEYENNKLISFIILSSLFLTISIIAERKVSGFHYTRLLIPFVILSAIAIDNILANIKIRKLSLYQSSIALLIIPLLLLFSPLPRYAKYSNTARLYFSNKDLYDEQFDIPGDNVVLRKSYLNVSKYIRENANRKDFIKTMAIGGNMINYFLDDYATSALPQSCFYYGDYNIKYWKNLNSSEIRMADWVIVQDNDSHPVINGHERSSFESLQLDTLNYNYISSNFSQDTIITPFIIFRRINNTLPHN